MADMNVKPNRVYYVLQMNLKCDTNKATNWTVGGSVKQILSIYSLQWEQNSINIWMALTNCHESPV